MSAVYNTLEMPISKREWELYNELKDLFAAEGCQALDSNTYHRYEEWLDLLTKRGVIWHIKADGAYLYQCQNSFDDFESWLKDQDKKAKKLNNREWKIAIASAALGALIGLIPTIVSMF